MSEKSGKDKIKATAARLAAVQALYQQSQNDQPVKALVKEYLHYRSEMEIDGEMLVKPDGALLKAILLGVDERREELAAVIKANKSGDKDPEPLLHSLLLCAGFELLAHDEIDPPIIMNDYLNVAHAFFSEKEVGFVNGILDAVSKALRV